MLPFLLAAAQAVAPVPAGAPAAAPAPAAKICRTVAVTGSNLPKRECRTAEAWKAASRSKGMDLQDRMQLDRMQMRGTGGLN